MSQRNAEQHSANRVIVHFDGLADVKFLILHEHKHDDGIRNFFLDIWELWVKVRSGENSRLPIVIATESLTCLYSAAWADHPKSFPRFKRSNHITSIRYQGQAQREEASLG